MSLGLVSLALTSGVVRLIFGVYIALVAFAGSGFKVSLILRLVLGLGSFLEFVKLDVNSFAVIINIA